MIFFIILKTLIIGAIIGGCLYAFASKESMPNQLMTNTGTIDAQNGTAQSIPSTGNPFVVALRFIRNLIYLILIILIPLIIFRFIV
ncbi:hypothetical protein [Polynucleobacter arcticus]|nr:hypothetical protein [Polynucleobacter arcticus]